MKKSKSIIFLAILMFGIYLNIRVGSVNASVVDNDGIEMDTTTISETEYLNNIAGIKEISGSELINLLDSNDSYILYIGYKGCPHCREFSRTLKEYVPIAPKPIYYINMENGFANISQTDYKKISDFMESAEVQYTPTVLDISNKTVVNTFVGDTVSLADLKNIE